MLEIEYNTNIFFIISYYVIRKEYGMMSAGVKKRRDTMVDLDKQYEYYGKCQITNKDCQMSVGNATRRIKIDKDIQTNIIRADLEMEQVRTIRIWGQIKDYKGKSVSNALVKLVREVTDDLGRIEYIGVAHGITDCAGIYQFDICAPQESIPATFRIFVNTQALGHEIRIRKATCDTSNENTQYLK